MEWLIDLGDNTKKAMITQLRAMSPPGLTEVTTGSQPKGEPPAPDVEAAVVERQRN